MKETPNATWPVPCCNYHSTYDGLLYNTDFIKKTLDVKSIHFDSAWVPYTNFSPIYEGKCGMSGGRVEGKVIYETQSTHKLLAAFSQASMIHVKGDVNEETFNEAVAELDALEEKTGASLSSAVCSLANMTAPTATSIFRRGLAVRKHRTGRACLSVCICAGLNRVVSKLNHRRVGR